MPETIGGLAQLARAPALQAGGQRFESVILHFVHVLIIGQTIFDMMKQAKLKSKQVQAESIYRTCASK